MRKEGLYHKSAFKSEKEITQREVVHATVRQMTPLKYSVPYKIVCNSSVIIFILHI
jgi:hypothetical protein